MKLENKITLITGSSRGIGRATALLFAREGADVIVNYTNSRGQAEEVVEQIKALGRKAIAIKCDVSDESQVKSMIEQIVAEFGRIDILVNNTGIVFDIPLMEKTVDQWKKTLEVNLIGSFLCSKYAVVHMDNNSRIVNVSSSNAFNSFDPTSTDYDAAKAGVVLLTKNLAKELGPKISVNAVAPGWVNTDMNKDLPKEYVDEEMQKTYLKRIAQPEEIAKAILFLASDDASYITGTILMIDGGHD